MHVQDTVVARLTVVSIRVSKLPSIHIVEENSPFVSLHCGQWRFTTEINSFAGIVLGYLMCIVCCAGRCTMS